MSETTAVDGQGKAQEAADAAREKASEVTGQAREKAGEAAGQARDRVRSQVDERSTALGEQVGTTATDLRTVGDELRKQGKDTPAKLADQAAERSEQVGRYLSESDADKILSDVEDFARTRPWAVVAGGLVLGFAASRVLKASSSDRYQARQSASPNGRSQSSNGTGTRPREIEGQSAGVATGAPAPAGF